MDTAKQKRLEAAGWVVESTADFLDLSPEEMAYIELRVRLSDALKERRKARRLSQAALATTVKSSQSRVAKMEAGDPSVTIDLLIRSLLAMGVSRKELASIMGFDAPKPVTVRRRGQARAANPKLLVATTNPASTHTASKRGSHEGVSAGL